MFTAFSAGRTGALDAAPAAGNANTPLYPAWIAAWMALDTGFRDSLLCIIQDRTNRAPCPMDFGLFVTAQLLLAAVTICTVWLLAKRLTGSMLIAWLAAGFALLAKAPYVYANQFLTEALLLPLFSLLILFLVLAYQDRRPAWLLAAGVALALATLTRPGYVYLFYAMTLLLIVLALWRRRKPAILSLVLFLVGFTAVVTPWMLRNERQFGTLALTYQLCGLDPRATHRLQQNELARIRRRVRVLVPRLRRQRGEGDFSAAIVQKARLGHGHVLSERRAGRHAQGPGRHRQAATPCCPI